MVRVSGGNDDDNAELLPNTDEAYYANLLSRLRCQFRELDDGNVGLWTEKSLSFGRGEEGFISSSAQCLSLSTEMNARLFLNLEDLQFVEGKLRND